MNCFHLYHWRMVGVLCLACLPFHHMDMDRIIGCRAMIWTLFLMLPHSPGLPLQVLLLWLYVNKDQHRKAPCGMTRGQGGSLDNINFFLGFFFFLLTTTNQLKVCWRLTVIHWLMLCWNWEISFATNLSTIIHNKTYMKMPFYNCTKFWSVWMTFYEEKPRLWVYHWVVLLYFGDFCKTVYFENSTVFSIMPPLHSISVQQ